MKLLSSTQIRHCLFGLLLLSIPSFAGVVFQVETTYHSGSPGVESSEMVVEKPNLKMEIPSGRRDGKVHKELIYRGDRDEVLVVDHDKREVVVVESPLVRDGLPSEADRDELAKRLSPAQREKFEAELERQVEQNRKRDLPKIRRQKVSRWQKRRARKAPNGIARKDSRQNDATAVARELAGSELGAEKPVPLGGYECQKYKVGVGSQDLDISMFTWATRDIALERPETAQVLDNLGSFYRDLLDDSELSREFGELFDGSLPLGELRVVDGFPVVTRSFSGGELESEVVLKSVLERDFDPDAFEPPKGYRLRTMGPQ